LQTNKASFDIIRDICLAIILTVGKDRVTVIIVVGEKPIGLRLALLRLWVLQVTYQDLPGAAAPDPKKNLWIL